MSRYENYSMKNNVFWTLAISISSLSTSIQLNNWQGARFSENMLATIEHIEDDKVKKREIVLIIWISGDVLTVQRKYWSCPPDDDSNTSWKVSFSFDVDDTISAYITKEHFDIIDKSINDIYENWLDKLRTDVVSWLQIKVNAWPVLIGSVYYDFAGGTITLTNNATNYVEINENGVLVANTTNWIEDNTKIAKITTSWWEVISIEDWRLWTVWGKISKLNIHELTEKQTVDINDEFVLADSNYIYNNKKISWKNIFDLCVWWQLDAVAGENLSVWDVVWIINNQVVKISISNQKLPKQFWIVRKSASIWDKVVVDLEWISKSLSNLTPWAFYYISSTAWVLTTNQDWWNIVWKAISSSTLQLCYSEVVTTPWTDYLLYEYNWFDLDYTADYDYNINLSFSARSGSTVVSLILNFSINNQVVDTLNQSSRDISYSHDFSLKQWDNLKVSVELNGGYRLTSPMKLRYNMYTRYR